ncbi:wd40 repeat protein [Anaeramoeba ignava]|uniref:Wd40 repeat protein n=1 Tax=Anaeramoeba ignava TaxID=1746090 RepID=A0A9Q0R507_ANAIG|nr:wd40 repeat protein [Anaeramoeba ignava]
MSFPSKLVHTLVGHEGSVLCVKFNYNGKYCLSCGQDRSVRLWNPHTGKLIKTYLGHGYEIVDLVVTNDNKNFITCGGDKDAYFWDVTHGKVLRKYRGHDHKINTLAINKESNVFFSGSIDRTVKIWDLRSRSTASIQTLDDFKDSVTSIYVSSSEIICGSVDGYLRTYDIRNGKLVSDFVDESITSISLSNDENCVLVSCLDNKLRMFNKDTGELLNEYSGHSNQNYKLSSCFANNDSFVVSGSEDNLIYIWDLVDAKVVNKLEGHKGFVCGLDYNSDKSCLLSSSIDGTICVWK